MESFNFQLVVLLKVLKFLPLAVLILFFSILEYLGVFAKTFGDFGMGLKGEKRRRKKEKRERKRKRKKEKRERKRSPREKKRKWKMR